MVDKHSMSKYIFVNSMCGHIRHLGQMNNDQTLNGLKFHTYTKN